MNKDLIQKRKLAELNKELSILKKCVAIFCTLILLLNIYYVSRVSSVDTSLENLMKKHKKTSKKISYVINRTSKKYENFLERRFYKLSFPEELIKSTEEMKPFVENSVEKIDFPDPANKKLFEMANAKLTEEISIFRMPFRSLTEEIGSDLNAEKSKKKF